MKVKAIHQLELSSHCNLRCVYCPSRHLGRPKVYMTRDVFERAIKMVYDLHQNGEQVELNLAGIGESTMHPHFREFVSHARIELGPRIMLVLATNGLNMTADLADHLAVCGVKTWVSLHRPEKAGPAVEHLRAASALSGVSADPSIAAIDWAGQVKWQKSATPNRGGCPWTMGGRIMLMADGRFTRCCLDADGRGILGHIDDGLPANTSPYVLCKNCDLIAGPELTPETMKLDTSNLETVRHYRELHTMRREKEDA